MEDLVAVRFPIIFHTGERGVSSIAEYLSEIPGRTPTYLVEAVDIITLHRLQHEAGLIEWDPQTRGIRWIRPLQSVPEVMQAWRKTLRPWPGTPASSGPPPLS